MPNSRLWIAICAVLFFFVGSSANPEEEHPPIKMTFINNSSFSIYLHLYEQETLIQAHLLKPKNKFELMVDHGLIFHLEYPPPPYKTVLKPIDSSREISRKITFMDDGEHVRIKEQFNYQKNVNIEKKKKKGTEEDEAK